MIIKRVRKEKKNRQLAMRFSDFCCSKKYKTNKMKMMKGKTYQSGRSNMWKWLLLKLRLLYPPWR